MVKIILHTLAVICPLFLTPKTHLKDARAQNKPLESASILTQMNDAANVANKRIFDFELRNPKSGLPSFLF